MRKKLLWKGIFGTGNDHCENLGENEAIEERERERVNEME